jgi:electron transfer flavoprotein-quinone oxidoreductase
MIPKLVGDGMLVAGDAAGFCLATGIYIEGINYAIQSGLAAGEAAIEACRRRDFTRYTLSQYMEFLRVRNVLDDFRAYRHAPDFVNGERLQNLYPELAAQGSEALFRVDGSRKQKLLPLYWRTLRNVGAKPHHVVQDLYKVARAYLW